MNYRQGEVKAMDARASQAVQFVAEEGVFTLTYRWRSPWHSYGLVVCATGAVAFGALAIKNGSIPSIVGLMGLLVLACCAGFYDALARLVNVTTLRIENGNLRVSHGPVPWGKARTVQVSEISRVKVKEHPLLKGGAEYDLHVQMKKGKRLYLVPRQTEPEGVKAAEAALKAYLESGLPGRRKS